MGLETLSLSKRDCWWYVVVRHDLVALMQRCCTDWKQTTAAWWVDVRACCCCRCASCYCSSSAVAVPIANLVVNVGWVFAHALSFCCFWFFVVSSQLPTKVQQFKRRCCWWLAGGCSLFSPFDGFPVRCQSWLRDWCQGDACHLRSTNATVHHPLDWLNQGVSNQLCQNNRCCCWGYGGGGCFISMCFFSSQMKVVSIYGWLAGLWC